ncbi:MAG: hypothetical protein V7731_09505 [Amphritea sp.]
MRRRSHRKLKPIHFLHNPAPELLADSVEAFLAQLGDATLIVVDGEDNTRVRAVATLLHGNEPSGVKAIYHWLRSGRRPVVKIICLVASVQTALHEPVFQHRVIPGQRDMNRCFRPPYDDHQGRIAVQFLDILEHYQPECLIDIHNTSGMSPSFGVAVHETPVHEALVHLFTQRLIITELRLGALMEISHESLPVVTIECGGSNQPESDQTAQQGLEQYLFAGDILKLPTDVVDMDMYRHAVRLELQPGTHIAYAEQPIDGADLTIPGDVEKFNFCVVPPLTRIGWLGTQGLAPLSMRNARNEDVLSQYLIARNQAIYTAQQLKLFMVTTSPAIAISDCLFYAAAETEHSLLSLR